MTKKQVFEHLNRLVSVLNSFEQNFQEEVVKKENDEKQEVLST